jgi:hypothetical protein
MPSGGRHGKNMYATYRENVLAPLYERTYDLGVSIVVKGSHAVNFMAPIGFG